jgi:hypothetical protein
MGERENPLKDETFEQERAMMREQRKWLFVDESGEGKRE